ncbi:phosphoacetylglucosamine mutase [Trypanosoma rangeli]|uniref:Phosphoacetylglucosamine mutase n=1 Tax=Trypanosoma rangeli TaxID=5698 RepID=A0A3R7KD29_TRYRA|nr:phosphoacetylglucosamine mutase [Trypanosoma rangeli]RNE98078.1 phosphoacetylglucosamine mutase [Trypanosoma rangeli]|eukprot:RNE98078.1 phosphoacetylglucosamine mutase [Trypanosoma rangeli]
MTLHSSFAQAVRECVAKFPLRHDVLTAPLAYGTAGFRTLGVLLPPVAARLTFVAVLRVCWAVSNRTAPAGCSVGCMVTASHNPAPENGLKLIDVDGGMLAISWEKVCTAAANAATAEELIEVLEKWTVSSNIPTPASMDDLVLRCPFSVVHIARDTRPSGKDVLAAVQTSLQLLHVPCRDYGVIATPQLHYLVMRANRPSTVAEVSNISDFGPALYMQELLSSLGALLHAVAPPTANMQRQRRRQKVVLDAANGVGAIAVKGLLATAQQMYPQNPLEEFFDIVVLHDDVEYAEALNHMCGADFTQRNRFPSEEMKKWAAAHERRQGKEAPEEREEVHYYSLDGDADRVVAFLHDCSGDKAWHLLDGDRMAILYAMLLQRCLGPTALQLLDVGVVQTAYANGASTDYLQHSLGLRAYSTPTGVKNLHPIAHARDIGVYFEANGHGTILFNTDAIASKLSAQAGPKARALLQHLPVLLSQVCGDGVADALACEVALLALEMDFHAWYRIYTDLPSRQTKVTVPNPKVITNTPDERRVLTPLGLQEAIDAAVTATASAAKSVARAFVRPSGTEPLVRVYAETSDAELCMRLSEEVENLVRQYCGAPAKDALVQAK